MSEVSGEAGGGGVPKWVIGLAIGVPVAAALAYILFGPTSGADTGGKKKSKKTPAKQSSTPSKETVAKASPKKKEDEVVVEDVEEEPKDPLEKATAAKNRGNKYFKAGRYELAIKCYSEAIDTCPGDKTMDLATFHQNRAAAYDQMKDDENVLKDCDTAINLNNKYVKALDRRAKILRKQAMQVEKFEYQVEKLKQCLEDITSVCVLEGFQKQEHLVMVDSVLKELGRAEAGLAAKNRSAVMSSKFFINQYFQGFYEDPFMKSLEKESEGDVDEEEKVGDISKGYGAARECFKADNFDDIIKHCDEEIESKGDKITEATLLRGTFFILCKQTEKALTDLNNIINDDTAPVKYKANALIKRASLHIQQCKDPSKDPELSKADFAKALEIDPDNADVHHHRAQVFLLTDETNKALVDFRKAVELQPNFAISQCQKLYTEYRAANSIGDHNTINKVIEGFKELTVRFPKCVETWALYAQVMSDQQEFQKADELYQLGSKLDPNNANLYVQRGLCALQSKGDITAAVELLEKALEIDEKCEFAYETLGTIEVQRGNLKRAIELFDKAIPLANTELEMAHLYGLRDAAQAQITVSSKLGISLPPMGI